MAGEIERHGLGDQRSAELVERYAGFAAAEHLSEQERLAAVASLVPMAPPGGEGGRGTIPRVDSAGHDSAAERRGRGVAGAGRREHGGRRSGGRTAADRPGLPALAARTAE